MNSDNPRGRPRWKSILRLFRIPALLTVPGDPLAGALLAANTTGTLPESVALGSTLAASLCLYAAGLLANDFFDRTTDARERPDRPIPSGAIRPFTVILLALLLTGAGLGFAARAGQPALWVALGIGGAAGFYDAAAKRVRILGPLIMGLCRGLSLLLGAAIFGPPGLLAPPVMLSALFLTLIVALVTTAARREASEEATLRLPSFLPWVLPGLLLLWLASLQFIRWDHGLPTLNTGFRGLAMGLSAMSVIWLTLWSVQWLGEVAPATLQRSIGGIIRGFILTQAAVCATGSPVGESFALLILVAFPVAGWLGKWFYAS